jgi:hypothetical protein
MQYMLNIICHLHNLVFLFDYIAIDIYMLCTGDSSMVPVNHLLIVKN